MVLPRTVDPRTGRPVSTLLRGSIYNDVGRWQQLRIDRLPRLLARQVRVLRSQMGPQVDGREAYLDRILLNVYGGPGTTHVWIDDLDIGGYVASAVRGDSVGPIVGGDSVGPIVGGDSVGDSPVDLPGTRPQGRTVELVGSVLTAGGSPLFPRAIRHRGEPLTFLKQLGFNAVWLDGPASRELLKQADRLGLWLICPPPRPTSPYVPEHRVAALPKIGPEYDQVLAWDLGRRLSKDQLEATRIWAEQVRLADRRPLRPLVCQPDGELLAYSRRVDSLLVLLIDRQPLGTSLELADYARWVRRQPRLARPGTTIWTTVQTQPSEALLGQLKALEPGLPPPISVPPEQIRLLAYMAVASGSRGLLFQSHSPLSANDPQTRQRAMALELLNFHLHLLEPWAAAGSYLSDAAGNRPEVGGAVLQTDRARLLLPIWAAPRGQIVLGQSAAHGVSLVVPGVSESSGAYLMVPGGLQPLRHQRVTGGMRVTLDEFGLSAAVLLAQDPLIVDSLTRRLAAMAPRAAELQRYLAVQKLVTVQHVVEQLAAGDSGSMAETVKRSAGWMDTARKDLQSCDGRLAAKDYQAACLYARRAMRALRLIEQAYWQPAAGRLTSPLTSPGTVSFATLPWHQRLLARIGAGRWGPNRLRGGDFESLQTMFDAGWNHFQHPSAGLLTTADLLPAAARSGFSGLRLTAEAEDPKRPPAVVETPPLWITSPAVAVEAGQLVCIEGWVQVPEAITGSVDGLMIIDSLSGEPLAERIRQTDGWKRFVLYRVAVESGPMTVTFALSGRGQAWLDDVTIRRLLPAGVHGVTRFPRPTPTRSANR